MRTFIAFILQGRRIERRLSYPLTLRLLAASNAFRRVL